MSGDVKIEGKLPILGVIAIVAGAIAAFYTLDSRVSVIEAKSIIIQNNIQLTLDKIELRLSRIEDASRAGNK